MKITIMMGNGLMMSAAVTASFSGRTASDTRVNSKPVHLPKICLISLNGSSVRCPPSKPHREAHAKLTPRRAGGRSGTGVNVWPDGERYEGGYKCASPPPASLPSAPPAAPPRPSAG